MLAKIEQLLQEIEGLQAANAEELEALRIKYLSKKGAINELMADFRNVPAEQKKEVGMKLNELEKQGSGTYRYIESKFLKPKITVPPKWILRVRLIPSNWEHATR